MVAKAIGFFKVTDSSVINVKFSLTKCIKNFTIISPENSLLQPSSTIIYLSFCEKDWSLESATSVYCSTSLNSMQFFIPLTEMVINILVISKFHFSWLLSKIFFNFPSLKVKFTHFSLPMRKLLPWPLPDLPQPCEKIASISMEKRHPFIRVATHLAIIWLFTDMVNIKIFVTF